MIGQNISNFLEKYPYEGKNRRNIHILFWIFWFFFIWAYTPNNFRPTDYNAKLFFLLAIRDVIWVAICFYFVSKYIFQTKTKYIALLALFSILLIYFSTHIISYFSFKIIVPYFNNISIIYLSKIFFESGFWMALLYGRSFWYITYWYSLYFAVPLMIKLLIEISSFRLKNIQLEKANIRLELDYLKSQVNPHFLFNTLNSIYSIVVDTEPKAAQIILKLSDLMRYSLYEANNDQVSLSREIQFIRDYVELEQVRHKKNVSIVCEIIGNPDNLEIPPLLLITFVENAFKHGINNNIKASRIQINIDIEEKDLSFRVENSKPIKLKNEKNQGGIGMWNVRKRLDILYPNSYYLEISNQPESYIVNLNIKLQ